MIAKGVKNFDNVVDGDAIDERGLAKNFSNDNILTAMTRFSKNVSITLKIFGKGYISMVGNDNDASITKSASDDVIFVSYSYIKFIVFSKYLTLYQISNSEL